MLFFGSRKHCCVIIWFCLFQSFIMHAYKRVFVINHINHGTKGEYILSHSSKYMADLVPFYMAINAAHVDPSL